MAAYQMWIFFSSFAFTLHYCLPGVLKINPEFRISWHFLNILNLLRCKNDKFKKFDAFKPKISHLKDPWLKGSLLEWVILCSKMSTFEPRFWRQRRARPHFSLPSYTVKTIIRVDFLLIHLGFCWKFEIFGV